MSFDAEEFVQYQLANAAVRRYPFPHLFLSPVFPEPYYGELLARLPPTERMRPIDDTGAIKVNDGKRKRVKTQAYPGRYVINLAEVEAWEQENGDGSFWLTLSQWLTGERFRALVMEKFRPDMAQRFGPDAVVGTDIDARLVRDFTRYAIGPHTDKPSKLVSLLFYLPRDASISHLGTSIYAHKDPAFRCQGNRHHGFADFKKVATMPFAPNALFAFFKTDYSFHGVERIEEEGAERNLLLYNIYVQAVSRSRGGFRWPWQRTREWAIYKPE